MRSRIAPTPSGYLHLGNGAAFVLTGQLVQRAGGVLFLRIDDLDAERTRPEFVQDIFDTLHWLGIRWEEGPRNAEDLHAHWSQQLRTDRYRALVEQLRETGHLYACCCSRKEIQERAGSVEYDGHCRRLGLPFNGPSTAWRLRLPEHTGVTWRSWPAGETRQGALNMADPVVLQRNGLPSYQIASLADDEYYKMDFIVRGLDLLPSTAVQHHIASLLGLPRFRQAIFLHHPLLLDQRGLKRSKSQGAGSLKEARMAGLVPGEVYRAAEELLRLSTG